MICIHLLSKAILKKITRHKQVIEWKQTFYFLKSNLLLEQIDFFLIRTLNEGIILVSKITIIVINNNVVRWICYLTLGSNFPISSFCSLCSSYSKFLELNLLTTTTHFFIPVRNSIVFHTFWNPSPWANHSLYL